MRINHNIAALNTHRQLNTASTAQSKSMEKLASGLRINKAGDDAAGLAISEKMRGQIRGLDMASKNAQDGISMIQTAEGALNETHDILQRMRELAVQSANDTNTDSDRAELQKEVDQLAEEITRIANNTEFNTQTLMNGGIKDGNLGKVNFHIGANAGQNISLDINAMDASSLGVSRNVLSGTLDNANAAGVSNLKGDSVDVSKSLAAGDYKVTVASTNAGSSTASKATGDTVTVGAGAVSGTANADTTVTLTYDSQAVNNADGDGTKGTATIASGTETISFARSGAVTNANADGYQVVFTDATNFKIQESDGAGGWTDVTGATGTVGGAAVTVNGIDVTVGAAASGAYANADTIEFTISDDTFAGGWTATGDLSGAISGSTNAVNGLNIDTTQLTGAADGDVVTVQGYKDASTTVQLFENDGTTAIGTAVTVNKATGGEYTIGDSTTGQLKVKFDANAATAGTSTVTVASDVSAASSLQADGTMSEAVSKGGINISSQTAADSAITTINKAIETVSAERSKLGAYQNRLEHTINNLNTSSENLTAAESRVRDVDMAKEMMNQTKNSILSQAAQAMLAQSNQMPQGVLQLLR